MYAKKLGLGAGLDGSCPDCSPSGLGNTGAAIDGGGTGILTSGGNTGSVNDKIKAAASQILAKYLQGVQNGTISQKAAASYFTNSRVSAWPGLTLEQTRQAYRLAGQGLTQGTASGTLAPSTPLPTAQFPPSIPTALSEAQANQLVQSLTRMIAINDANYAKHKNVIYTNANTAIRRALEQIKQRTVKAVAPAPAPAQQPTMSDPVSVNQPVPQTQQLTQSQPSGVIENVNAQLREAANTADQLRQLYMTTRQVFDQNQPAFARDTSPFATAMPASQITAQGGGVPTSAGLWDGVFSPGGTRAELTNPERVADLDTIYGIPKVLFFAGVGLGAVYLLSKKR